MTTQLLTDKNLSYYLYLCKNNLNEFEEKVIVVKKILLKI